VRVAGLWFPIASLTFLYLTLSGATAYGHDIGVTQAELIELEGGTYQFVARIGPGTAYLHARPELPGHCEFSGTPRGVQTPGSRLWEFDCDGRLTADDDIVLPWRRDGAMVAAEWLDGSSGRRLFGNVNGVITVGLGELQAGSSSLADAVGRYTRLGIEHILEGIDHLLFVLGLLMIVSSNLMLVKTITAFTVAHSLTLGLATLGFVDFPTRPVEAAIALSIVFLAMEVVRGWQGHESLTHRKPWLVAFGFGLLHGLGFAGALADVGLPQGEIPVALLFFNVGVEIGQLMFVAVVLLGQAILKWLASRKMLQWPTWMEFVPVYVIGTVGAYWVIERVNAIVVIG
jgi:hypothetical protein